jgi:DeoR/GlpR family transcriptional regulator of sugar metabolism
MRAMTVRSRADLLLDIVRTHGTVSIETLSRELGVGPSTVRRNLQHLADEGRIVRTYGGATLPETAGLRAADHPIDGAKRRIAVAALGLVGDGDTIVISSGTTAFEFARELVRSALTDLTVITNSLDIAQLLVDRQGFQVVVLGGVARPGMRSLLGSLTELACRELQADTLFMGAGAVRPEIGVMNDYMPEVVTDRALRSMARRVVVLADSSKFESVSPAIVLPMSEVAVVVTDEGIDPRTVDVLRRRGIDVVVAPNEGERP